MQARKLLTKGHLSRTGPKPHEVCPCLTCLHTHPLSLSPSLTTLVVQGRIVVDSKRLEVATHKMMAFPTMKAWLISKVRISLLARHFVACARKSSTPMVFLAGVPQDCAHAPAAVVDNLAQRISPALPVLPQGKTTGAQCDDGARTRTCSLKRMHTFLSALVEQ